MTQSDVPSTGLSRRDLLKRGAVVGVTAAWTVPLVQVVSMTPAHADSPSAPPVNQPPVTRPENPPPLTTTAPPPTRPKTHSAPPHHSSSAHAAVAPAASATTSAADSPATTTSVLANTGATYPVAPTVGVGAAAIALGAGALTAAHALKKRQESSSDA